MLTECNLVKYLPAWFPGAGFLQKAAAWKETIVDSVDFPFSLLKARMVFLPDFAHICASLSSGLLPQNAGTAPPSFCSTLLQESDPAIAAFAIDEFDIKWTANSMYAASMDTVIILFFPFVSVMPLTILRRP